MSTGPLLENLRKSGHFDDIEVGEIKMLKRTPQILLIIKPTGCTKLSNLFLEWNSTCFGQVFCPSSGV